MSATLQSHDVEQMVRQALNDFKGQDDSQCDLISVARGLDAICRAASADFELATLPTASVAVDLLLQITPAVAAKTDAAIAQGRVFFGMSAAAALVARPRDGFHQDRIDHVAILACELVIFARREALIARGDPLPKFVAIRHAWALEQPMSDQVH